MKKTVAIAMGGYSSEYQISLNSGNVVFNHLDRSKFMPYRVHILEDGWYALDDNNHSYTIDKGDFSFKLNGKRITFDVVFNTIHGTPGEDGKFQGYLNILKIPQTACPVYQAALTFNKRDTLSILKAYNIKAAINVFINQGEAYNIDSIIERVGLPCFVKANRAGSSFGVSKVHDKKDFKAAVEKAFKEDDEVLVESFLNGTEVSVGVLEYNDKLMALPVTEIVSENDFFDYDAKYNGKSQEITPARITESQREQVQEEALKIYRFLKLKGITRSDFIFHNNKPHFIEVNTTPGLSEASIIPQQAMEAGISLKELFGNVIDSTLKCKLS